MDSWRGSSQPAGFSGRASRPAGPRPRFQAVVLSMVRVAQLACWARRPTNTLRAATLTDPGGSACPHCSRGTRPTGVTRPRAGAKVPKSAWCVGPARLCLEALGVLDCGLAQLWRPGTSRARRRRKGDHRDGNWTRPRSSHKPAAWVLLGSQTMPASRAPEVHCGLRPRPWGPGSWTAGWSQVWGSRSGGKDEPVAGRHWPSTWAIPCKSLLAGHAGGDITASKRFSLTPSSKGCTPVASARRWLTLACLPVEVAGAPVPGGD